MRVHFIVNTFRPVAIDAAKETVSWLRAEGVEALVEPEAAELSGLPALDPTRIGDCDLVVCLGGDGTLIRAAHLVSRQGTPLLGVNFGRFGFVCACPPDARHNVIRRVLDGAAVLDERAMVQTDLERDGHHVASLHSLNEAAVTRAATTRLLTFEVAVNGIPLARYPADGVMIATPTGSTAYNLSAGGPIVHPSVPCLVMSPIMPHALGARSIVLGADAVAEIRVEARGDAVLSCDGHSRLTLLSGDLVKVVLSPRVTRLVRVTEDDFLHKVSERFVWGRIYPDEPEESC